MLVTPSLICQCQGSQLTVLLLNLSTEDLEISVYVQIGSYLYLTQMKKLNRGE